MHVFIADLLILVQVLMIDLVLAGDNAVVIGLAVGRLAPAQRRQAIIIGIGAATILRIALALIALRLIAVIGLTLAGGILLLYVAWKSWREFAHAPPPPRGGAPAKLGGGGFGVFIAGF
jgi:predicted tellurium resistance membrane protein TerC